MKLEQISINCHVLHLGENQILFSYETPVASFLPGSVQPFMRTVKQHGPTTSRHINSWLGNADAGTADQSWFDNTLETLL